MCCIINALGITTNSKSTVADGWSALLIAFCAMSGIYSSVKVPKGRSSQERVEKGTGDLR